MTRALRLIQTASHYFPGTPPWLDRLLHVRRRRFSRVSRMGFSQKPLSLGNPGILVGTVFGEVLPFSRFIFQLFEEIQPLTDLGLKGLNWLCEPALEIQSGWN